ncbi:hypothetical protein [Rubrivirga marina]|uniref:Uncharacterized protein n=1 Tax=Rubrivirga marina TaxID=1196024 RepID=A0A271J531_9BACT|nr:hypothetical protein [Rubrivirga marina]PAP78065.1 hypothetical protein BSZ37_17285 [Rubrivirga marina]
MRPRYSLLALAAFGVLFAGCDTAPTASDTAETVRLDVQAAPTGDVLYDLTPLRQGESFDVALDVGVDDLTLRSTRTSAGYELAYVPGEIKPETVVVSYFAHGVMVAQSTTDGGEPVVAGAAAEGPDSWHYVWRDGSWIIAKDYNNDLTNGDTTPFTLPSGEVIEVSDVTFTLVGLDTPAPQGVRFDAPQPVDVTAQAFGRPLR